MTEVNVKGPLLDGRSVAIIASIADEATGEVAAQASAYVHTILDQRIKNPTPYYETQVTVQRVGRDRRVHDRGIIYGPWLEGTGSRNKTTRFKGYAAFRTSAQLIERDVERLTDAVIRRRIGELS